MFFFVKIVDNSPESNEKTSNQVEVSLQNVKSHLVTPATGPDLVKLLLNNDQSYLILPTSTLSLWF